MNEGRVCASISMRLRDAAFCFVVAGFAIGSPAVVASEMATNGTDRPTVTAPDAARQASWQRLRDRQRDTIRLIVAYASLRVPGVRAAC